ncbi:hypothetical protein [Novosphingobium sp.]|uniref:hypothetical protein n=1 Tax=Novosphingobium sp. TaxID=1874826 RepID=UPI002FDB2ED7
MTQQAFITPHDLIKRWGGAVTIGTLANWRCQRVGPTYAKIRGRVLYPVAKLEAWEAENTHHCATGGLTASHATPRLQLGRPSCRMAAGRRGACPVRAVDGDMR